MTQERGLDGYRAPGASSGEARMASQGVLDVFRLGEGGLDLFLRPSETEGTAGYDRSRAPLFPLPRYCWGRAHLGDMQGVLRDVVLQGGTIAVASCPERQAPGRAHGAVLFNIVVAP